jgi:hypothetical protein
MLVFAELDWFEEVPIWPILVLGLLFAGFLGRSLRGSLWDRWLRGRPPMQYL